MRKVGRSYKKIKFAVILKVRSSLTIESGTGVNFVQETRQTLRLRHGMVEVARNRSREMGY